MTVSGTLLDELKTAWTSHWPYFKLAVVLFILGSIVGAGLIVLEIDLFAALGFGELEEAFPEEITTFTLLLNNTIVFALALLGVFSFGLLSVLILLFNGVVVGYIVAPAVQEVSLGFVIVAIVPHGILELSAFFVASAVTFRLVHRFVLRLRDRSDHFLDPGDRRRIGLLLLVAWVALAVAAVIEVHVTVWLVETLYPELQSAGV